MPKNRNSENDIAVSGAGVAPRRQPSPKPRAKRSSKPVEIPAVEITSADAVSEPTPEEIAQLAYSYWEARGGQGGSAEEDWIRAEESLRAQVNAATA
jgi:hypothetical protein